MRITCFPVQALRTPMDSPCRIHPGHSTWFCMTAISSILDSEIRRNICADMLRVLRSPDPASGKPGGLILWYDFWLNPTNPQTRGVRFLLTIYHLPFTIYCSLFPNCHYEFHRITLAPPLARRVVPVSWILAYGLERLKIFNSVPFGDTHYLVAIRPRTGDGGLMTAKSPQGDHCPLLWGDMERGENRGGKKRDTIYGRYRFTQYYVR